MTIAYPEASTANMVPQMPTNVAPHRFHSRASYAPNVQHGVQFSQDINPGSQKVNPGMVYPP